MMRQAHLARSWDVATANEAGIRSRVMRRAERPCRHQCLLAT